MHQPAQLHSPLGAATNPHSAHRFTHLHPASWMIHTLSRLAPWHIALEVQVRAFQPRHPGRLAFVTAPGLCWQITSAPSEAGCPCSEMLSRMVLCSISAQFMPPAPCAFMASVACCQKVNATPACFSRRGSSVNHCAATRSLSTSRAKATASRRFSFSIA